MTYSRPNASPATMSRNRVSPAPQSGICVTCLDGCPGPCEVGRSALRGREILYPQPFAKVTAGAEKDYPVDFSHFNIQGSCVGARGFPPILIAPLFPAVDISSVIGAKRKNSFKNSLFYWSFRLYGHCPYSLGVNGYCGGYNRNFSCGG